MLHPSPPLLHLGESPVRKLLLNRNAKSFVSLVPQSCFQGRRQAVRFFPADFFATLKLRPPHEEPGCTQLPLISHSHLGTPTSVSSGMSACEDLAESSRSVPLTERQLVQWPNGKSCLPKARINKNFRVIRVQVPDSRQSLLHQSVHENCKDTALSLLDIEHTLPYLPQHKLCDARPAAERLSMGLKTTKSIDLFNSLDERRLEDRSLQPQVPLNVIRASQAGTFASPFKSARGVESTREALRESPSFAKQANITAYFKTEELPATGKENVQPAAKPRRLIKLRELGGMRNQSQLALQSANSGGRSKPRFSLAPNHAI